MTCRSGDLSFRLFLVTPKRWMERRSTKDVSEVKAASDQEARRVKRHLGQVKRQRAHQARVGNPVAGHLERHQGGDLGGDVHILYDQVRDEELHWGARLKRTNGRDTYSHV